MLNEVNLLLLPVSVAITVYRLLNNLLSHLFPDFLDFFGFIRVDTDRMLHKLPFHVVVDGLEFLLLRMLSETVLSFSFHVLTFSLVLLVLRTVVIFDLWLSLHKWTDKFSLPETKAFPRWLTELQLLAL